MPAVVVHAALGQLPPLADPNIARDYVYTDDVSDAFVRAARRRGQERGAVYNIGTGRQTTLRQLAATARRTLKVKARPVWGSMANRRWDATTWVSDPRAAGRALGWRARTTLDAGLRRMAAWLDAEPQLAARYRAAILRSAPPRRAAR